MENQKPTYKDEFVAAALLACANEQKQGIFQCPICQSTAIAMKSNVNGHLMASCPNCKEMFRQ